MTRAHFFEELRAEQDQLREQVGYLERARARRDWGMTRKPASRRRRAAWLLAGALGLAGAALLWQRWPGNSAQLAFTLGDSGQQAHAGAFVAAPAGHELPLRFADGTRFALAAGSSARVASLEAHGAHLVLEKGRAVASVVHHADSHWRVDVGPFQVAVVGTRFDVRWDEAKRVLELQLDEGAVRVSGGLLGASLEVRAGQRLRAFADDARVELSGADAAQVPQLGEAAAPSQVTQRPAPGAATSPASAAAPALLPSATGPTWQALAAAGKFREALAAVEKAGFDAECQRASGADLVALGDAARLSGSAGRAEQAYRAARGKLPGGGRASYGLGLVAFDQRGDFAGAARHFEAYLREQPSGALRAEATGRLMEALQRAGRVGDARRVAEQYLARYPKGPQAPRAKQLLE